MRAALIYDGYLTIEQDKLDALIVEAQCYLPNPAAMQLAIPYRPAYAAAGFAVHRPKFLEVGGEDPDFSLLAQAFFEGVDQHEQGGKIWNEYLDESI